MMKHLTMTELKAGLDEIRQSPGDHGRLALIVNRPAEDERVVQETGELSLEEGLVGDNWRIRGSKAAKDGSALMEAQITITNSRAIALYAQDDSRWALAGDQLYVDLDLSAENLPPGQQLAIGTAVLQLSSVPHNGCKKFANRFGVDVMKFANSAEGKQMRLRGINTRVIRPGIIRVGDTVRKV